MKIEPAIRTLDEIESLVYSASFSGGWRKRVNAKRNLILASNRILESKSEEIRAEIRKRKAGGGKDCELRHLWADLSGLQQKIIT